MQTTLSAVQHAMSHISWACTVGRSFTCARPPIIFRFLFFGYACRSCVSRVCDLTFTIWYVCLLASPFIHDASLHLSAYVGRTRRGGVTTDRKEIKTQLVAVFFLSQPQNMRQTKQKCTGGRLDVSYAPVVESHDIIAWHHRMTSPHDIIT